MTLLKWLLSTSLSPGESYLPTIALRSPKRSTGGSDPDYFKCLPLHYHSKNVTFCIQSVRVVFLFPKALHLFHTQDSQTSNFNVLEAILSCAGLQGWRAQYGAWTLCSLGTTSVMWLNVIIFLFMGHLPWDIRLDYTASIPFYPLFWSSLYFYFGIYIFQSTGCSHR